MSKSYRAVKGMRDLLPSETAIWSAVESAARRVFKAYGYGEIRTPIVEDTELFVRSVGESTDIVGKEMYSFGDRKGRKLSLRPESTASVVRSFVQHGLHNASLPCKLFYVGPHFRYERPQRGRYRQFHQIGAELLGDAGPASDAEVILMLRRFLSELGFASLVVRLNSVGDCESRFAYREGLLEYLAPRKAELSSDSRRRFEENPLRILDSKNPQDRQLLDDAPSIIDYLSASSREHFEEVQHLLDHQGVAFTVDPRLVRGLDYYTGTVFEIASADLGSQDAIVGGGRYDDLVESLGGPPIPAIGFAIGEDRLIDILPESFVEYAAPKAPVFLVPVGAVPRDEILEVAELLRDSGIEVETELASRSAKAVLKRADRAGARWAILLGEEEIANGTVTLKNLRRGEQAQVSRSEIVANLEGEQ